MRLRELKLKNFRCFADLSLELDRDLTLIFGVSGAGKSTLVDALGRALSLIPGLGGPQPLAEQDLRWVATGAGGLWGREREAFAEITLQSQDPDHTMRWRLERGGRAEATGDHKELGRKLNQDVGRRDATLPVLAIYRALRTWEDGATDPPPAEGRLSGLAGGLDAGDDLGGLRAWWRDLDHMREKGLATPALAAVEQAVAGLVGPKAALPLYDPASKDIFIDIPRLGGRFALSELSDGYRGLIGLTADIARRAATLNPLRGEDLLQTITGVVIIDEIDLHLHPRLQVDVLPRLRETFPKVQLVVTTHSSLVLGSVRDNSEVFALEEAHSLSTGLRVEGRDPDRILAEVMGARLRPPQLEATLRALHDAIDAANFVEAERLLAILAEKWGEIDPEVVRARGRLAWER